MTDSRPEITAKADGAQVVLRLAFRNNTVLHIPYSAEECFALQCQLSAAMELVRFAQFSADQIEKPWTPEKGGVCPKCGQDHCGHCPPLGILRNMAGEVIQWPPPVAITRMSCPESNAVIEKPQTWRDRESML